MFALLTVLIGLHSHAQNLQADRQKFLQAFDQNPALASTQLPPKYNLKGKKIQSSPFQAATVESRQFVTLKDEARKQTCKGSKPGQPCQAKKMTWAGVPNQNEMEYFLENTPVERNLERLEALNLQSGQTARAPWSGDYWATANGGIAVRYNDPEFPAWKPFSEIFNYMGKASANWNVAGSLDVLSPSEKYDLLMGDANKTLTQTVLAESNEVFTRDGKIESWWGICHGWAPAAFMMDRPQKTVEVQLPNLSQPLKFFPDDLKALASHVWANASYDQIYIGGRCDDKDPAKDANGRVISERCFDINPASWHLALLHQTGLQQQSFVMDATFDYEVWNQPIKSYQYTYFNPQTKLETADFRHAMIPIMLYAKDPYANYRNPETTYVIGVAMTVNYVKEVTPSADGTNSEEADSVVAVQYYYDLELDVNGNIIGGEWYQQAHPDFLWKPVSGAKALTAEDSQLEGQWTDVLPPATWTAHAQEASKSSQPLYRVVEELIRKAQ